MNWKFWELFKSETTVEDAIEHSVGYSLSPDDNNVLVHANDAAAARATVAQPISAQSLNLDYTFVFPANAEGGMPKSRFEEPWEKDTKKKA
jgi:hypothetical protein